MFAMDCHASMNCAMKLQENVEFGLFYSVFLLETFEVLTIKMIINEAFPAVHGHGEKRGNLSRGLLRNVITHHKHSLFKSLHIWYQHDTDTHAEYNTAAAVMWLNNSTRGWSEFHIVNYFLKNWY